MTRDTKTTFRRLGFCVGVLGGAFVAGQAASLGATFTTVNGLSGTGASSHLGILQDVYGGAWAFDGGVNFSSDIGVNAVRIADNPSGGGAGTPLLLGGTNYSLAGVTDQVWQDGTVNALAEAKYAAQNQSFGFYDGSGSGGLGTFNRVFRVTGGTDASPSQTNDLGPLVSVGDASSHQFQWGRAGWFIGWNDNQQSSRASNNLFGADHMVTYAITDASGTLLNWMLFFEDTNVLADNDFNDLVVQVTPVAKEAVVVPLPSAVLMGGVGLLGLISVQMRRFLMSR